MSTHTPRKSAAWSLDGRTAVHRFAGSTCRLDLDHPETGAVVDGPDGDRLLGVDVGRIAGAADHWIRGGDLAVVYEPDDSRRLRATAMWRLPPAEPASGGLACELILSAQTSLLESDSGLAVVTEFTAGRVFHGWVSPDSDADAATRSTVTVPTATMPRIVWRTAEDDAATSVPAGVTAVLVRREGPSGPGSIGFVAVHPADVREIRIEKLGGRVRITCWLFTGDLEQTLEKGVLLRGRVLASLEPLRRAASPDGRGPADGDDDTLARAAAAIQRFNGSPPPLTT